MARKFEKNYRVRESDDVLEKTNRFLQDVDQRIDAVEQIAEEFRAGNRTDVDAIVEAINHTIAARSAEIQALINEQADGFTPDRIIETDAHRFTSDAEIAALDAADAALAEADTELADAIAELVEDVAAKAALASPALIGTPTAPTPALNSNDTRLATTAFVQALVAAIVNAAPGQLDTLKELATALGNDANFASSITALLAQKAPLASPVFTGTPTAPTQATGNSSTRLANTAFVHAVADALAAITVARSDAGLLAGFRNKIINGDFDVWQRAVSQTLAGYGSDDRWSNLHNGSTKTVSRQAFALGQTDVPGNPKYFSRTVVASAAGAGNYCSKVQRIERVATFAGKTATVTLYAKADAAKNMCVELAQIFGTGGAPSGQVNGIGVTTLALTAAWKKFTFTVAIPSITGKTIGTDGNDHLALHAWFEAGSSFNARTNALGNQSGTFDIAHVSLDEGDATAEADPFSARQVHEEAALCRRYYQRQGLGINGWTSTAVQIRFSGSMADMRVNPTVALLNPTPQFVVGNGTQTGVASTLSTISVSTNGFRGALEGFSGMTPNIPAHLITTTDILSFEAEL